jgi:hypothetical protein
VFVSAKVRLKEKPTVAEGKLQESELYIVQQLEGEIRVAVETLHLERDNEAKYVNCCCCAFKCQARKAYIDITFNEML